MPLILTPQARLTRDADTLKALLPALDPFIMPGTGGSNALRLAEEAANLFEQSKSDPKVLIMVTDGVEPKDIEPAAELLRKNKIQLSILAIGTEQGAPMLQPDGRFFKGADGQPIMPSLEWENLKAFASSANGKIQRFSNTDSDIDYLLSESNQNESFKEVSDLAVYDQWQDNGFWLMIPVLLLSLFAFRRGVVLMALLALFQPQEVWAMPDFLLNQDQKAHKQFDKNPEQAAELFSNPEWKASSLYKAGKYEEALEIWQNQNDSKSWYNQGNAHAQLGQFDEAIYAYEQALANDENFADAQFNKELVEQLKQQQEQQNQDNQNRQDSSESQQDDNSQQQNQENQNNESQSNSEQSKSEPQDSTQQSEGDNSDNPMNELTDSDKSQQAQETEQNTQQSNSEEKAEENQQAQMTQTEGQQPKEITEKDQAVMQMIQKIPDNPAGLLQRKFLHQYQQRNRNQQGGDRKSW